MTMFKPAVKHESKLRLAIAGPSGSGKTYSALAIGTALGKTAVVDTEHGSAAKYADLFPFDVLEMSAPFHPDRFVEAINAASGAGYDVLIIDSLSHAWNGAGGLLEIVDQIAGRMKTSNSFAAWKDATPIQNALIEAIVGSRIHIIATMRSKQEYVLEQVERNGRTISQPKKVGMAPVQRDSMEYEFDVYLDMTIENDAIVQKTRCPQIAGAVFSKPGAELAATLREWLSGVPAPEKPAAPKSGNGVRWIDIPEKMPPSEIPMTGRDDHEHHISPGAEIQTLNEYENRVYIGKPAEFFKAAADWIGCTEQDAKDGLRKLGYAALDKQPMERVKQLRQLHNAMLLPDQRPLFDDEAVADGAYSEA
jgi:hypothetical protein